MKVVKNYNYRVVIEPRGLGDFGGVRMSETFVEPDEVKRNRRYKERCEEIAKDVKRHVDSIGSVSVDYDTEEVCSHCGYTWELDEEGVPVCCNKAIDEHNATKIAQP